MVKDQKSDLSEFCKRLMSNEYLDGLTEEDFVLSQRMLEELKGKIVEKCRYDSTRKELFIEFEGGKRLFVDHLEDKYNISIQ